MKNETCRGRVVWVAVLMLLGPSATGVSAQDDKKPARKEPFTLTITGENDAELAPVVGGLTRTFYESYSRLVERFEHPDRPAPRRIRVVFASNMRVPAYCSRDEIKISVDWMKKHPDDLGIITHELTHAVQAYPRFDPGWLTEGIADYARHVYGPEEQPGWELPTRLSGRRSYKDGYRVTGRFLLWLDEKHKGVVDKVHRRMQDREYTDADFKKFTGKTVGELWDECVKDLRDKG